MEGASLADEPYAIERRALCLTVESETVELELAPASSCVNPVLELEGAQEELLAVRQDGQLLDAGQYRWDGRTLWLSARFDQPTTFELQFADGTRTE